MIFSAIQKILHMIWQAILLYEKREKSEGGKSGDMVGDEL